MYSVMLLLILVSRVTLCTARGIYVRLSCDRDTSLALRAVVCLSRDTSLALR